MTNDTVTTDAVDGPPTTARLRAVLDRAARVVVVEAGPDGVDEPGHARTEVTGAGIAELAGLLEIVDGGTGDRCLCWGRPTILLHGPDGALLGRWSLHHQEGIRALGDCDAELVHGEALTEWLAGRGLTGSREEQAELARQEAEEQRRQARWLQAAPPGVAGPATAAVLRRDDDLLAWSAQQRADRAGLAELVRQLYPVSDERIHRLLAWLGVCAREKSGGMMWYDLSVGELLMEETPEQILALLADGPVGPAEWDGAAELFMTPGWARAVGRELPGPVRSRLAEHIRASGTGPMRFRLERGSYGTEPSLP